MKKNVFQGLFLLVSFLFATVWACTAAEDEQLQMAPDLTLPSLSGQTTSLADFKGRVVLLNFFATWCPPCRREIPDFVRLQADHGPKGFTVVGVSLDTHGVERVRAFTKAYRINYPVLYAGDRQREVMARFNYFRGIPTTVLINRQGRIIRQVTGAVQKEYWEKALEDLL